MSLRVDRRTERHSPCLPSCEGAKRNGGAFAGGLRRRLRLGLLALLVSAGCGRDLRDSIPFLPDGKFVDVGGRKMTRDEVAKYERIKSYSAATRVNPKDAVAYNALGEEFQKAGNYDLAKELYVQALQLDSALSEAHHNLGRIALCESNYPDALTHLGRALKLSPDDAHIYHRLGQACAGKGDSNQALSYFDLSLQKDNEYTPAYLDKARTLYGLRRFREAEECCRQALRHIPKPVAATAKEERNAILEMVLPTAKAEAASDPAAEVAYDLALSLKAQGRLGEALAELFAAEKCAAARADVQMLKSQLLEGLGRTGEALTVLETLRAEFPEMAEIPKRLARLYQVAGRDKDAVQARLVAAELDHSDKALQAEAAKAAVAAKDIPRIIAIYERLARLDPNDLGTLRVLAQAYEDAGIHRQAALTWQEIVAKAPQDLAARRRLGFLYADLPGFQGRAILQFKAVLDANPRDNEARRRLGELYLDGKSLAEAEKQLRWAVEVNPKDPVGHLRLGDLYRQGKRSEEAAAEYKKALELKPDLLEARLRYAQSLRDLDRKEDALVPLKTYLQAKPLDEEARRQYAEILRDLNRREEAVQEYQALAALHPNDPITTTELAKLTRLLGKTGDAAGMYEALLEKNPANVEALRSNARLYDEMKQPLRAMYCWQRLFRLQPADLEAQGRLASIYKSLGADDAALEKYEVLGKSGDAEGWRNAAFLHLKREDRDAAIAAYRKVLELQKQDVKARLSLAALLQRQENAKARDEALELYQQAVQLDPKDLAARLNLANLLTETNRLADAQEQYQDILAANPNSLGAHVGMGVILRKRGRHKEALEHYELALKAEPNNRQLHYNMGLLYDFYLDDPAAAKQHYSRYLELQGDPKLLPGKEEEAKEPAAKKPELPRKDARVPGKPPAGKLTTAPEKEKAAETLDVEPATKP